MARELLVASKQRTEGDRREGVYGRPLQHPQWFRSGPQEDCVERRLAKREVAVPVLHSRPQRHGNNGRIHKTRITTNPREGGTSEVHRPH
jgi:hypothetical protein